MRLPLALALSAVLGSSAVNAATRDYVVVERTVDVAGSADQVWKKIGDFCFIGKMLDFTCEIEVGSGGIGTVRRLNGTIVETMVAHSARSYTYSQPEGPRAGTDYHGTLSVDPISRNSSRISYTLIVDQAKLAQDVDRQKYKKAIEDRFQGAIDKAKSLVEGK